MDSGEVGFFAHPFIFLSRYAIEEMDKIFDLVMITDRFEESIVLLRDLLCMSDEDVIYLALKVRRETQSTELTTDEGHGRLINR